MRFTKENDSVVNVSIVDELSDDDAAANAARVESEEQAATDAADFEARQAEENAALEAKDENAVSTEDNAEANDEN